MFGSRHAAANYRILYTTKGVAAIFWGGLAAVLFEKTTTWDIAFHGSAALWRYVPALAAIGLHQMALPKKRTLEHQFISTAPIR